MDYIKIYSSGSDDDLSPHDPMKGSICYDIENDPICKIVSLDKPPDSPCYNRMHRPESFSQPSLHLNNNSVKPKKKNRWLSMREAPMPPSTVNTITAINHQYLQKMCMRNKSVKPFRGNGYLCEHNKSDPQIKSNDIINTVNYSVNIAPVQSTECMVTCPAQKENSSKSSASPNDFLDEELCERFLAQLKKGYASYTFNLSEVNADAILTQHTRSEKVCNAAQIVYGTDFERKIRLMAGPDPGKVAKRKHQIGSLYYQAQLMELDLIDKQSQRMKSKASTASKYGW